ncbi:HNH endonuclease family protein [Streptomyces sp. NPDC005576]|uniref:HNH endonuclease family protein n=1 Tax=Streptomyces sp. NPDC005576 TaxID=3364726 RepID=UPI0036AEC673
MDVGVREGRGRRRREVGHPPHGAARGGGGSGAYGWTAEHREAYANDLGSERSLIAVTAKSNRSKADKDPASWLPPTEDDRCVYATDWTATKLRWELSADEAEHAALLKLAEACPDAVVEYEATPDRAVKFPPRVGQRVFTLPGSGSA